LSCVEVQIKILNRYAILENPEEITEGTKLTIIPGKGSTHS